MIALQRILKFTASLLVELLAQCARLLPVKNNRIVFIAHRGQYSDSPMLISEKLQEADQSLEICWVFKEPHKYRYLEERGIRLIKFHSWGDFYYSNTAGVYVTNLFGAGPYIVKRRGKLILETSHGVAYKSLLTGDVGSSRVGWIEHTFRRRKINRANICLSGNCLLTDLVYRKELAFKGEIVERGLPRNDIFSTDTSAIRASIINRLGLKPNHKVALLMPTWRRDNDSANIALEYRLLTAALSRAFGGDWVVLLRLHHLSKVDVHDILSEFDSCVKNVTFGFDAQELLCSADVLITDYSSVIWDFALRRLPILLYQPDLAAYEDERGFNVPPREWGLYAADTQKGLHQLLEDYTYEEFCTASCRHLEKFKCYETGNATEVACELIHRFIDGESCKR